MSGLLAAIELARSHPVDLIAGDAVTELPGSSQSALLRRPLCVFHSMTLNQFLPQAPRPGAGARWAGRAVVAVVDGVDRDAAAAPLDDRVRPRAPGSVRPGRVSPPRRLDRLAMTRRVDWRHGLRTQPCSRGVPLLLSNSWTATSIPPSPAMPPRWPRRCASHTSGARRLKKEAHSQGLWNLFLPDKRWGAGLSVLDSHHWPRSPGEALYLAPEALNCSARHGEHGDPRHVRDGGAARALAAPLFDGEIRSCFSMTEPDVASSDATNIRTSITPGGRGVRDKRPQMVLLEGTRPALPALDRDGGHQPRRGRPPPPEHGLGPARHARGAPGARRLGVRLPRPRGSRRDQLRRCPGPVSNPLGEEGGGFAIAQARLGPGRIHHCMRALGLTERGLELMCRRAAERSHFRRGPGRSGWSRGGSPRRGS